MRGRGRGVADELGIAVEPCVHSSGGGTELEQLLGGAKGSRWRGVRGMLEVVVAFSRAALDGGIGVVVALRGLGDRHTLRHSLPTKKTLLALVDHVGEE